MNSNPCEALDQDGADDMTPVNMRPREFAKQD